MVTRPNLAFYSITFREEEFAREERRSALRARGPSCLRRDSRTVSLQTDAPPDVMRVV